MSILQLICSVEDKVMTRTNTRSSEARENVDRETTEYTFEEQDSLHIPEAVTNRFLDEGMTLGWLRITLKGQEDYKYIGRKLQEGWEFVKSEDVPELGSTSVVRDTGRYSGAVCRGDIALGKIPTRIYEARGKHYRKKSDELMEAVNSQLMRGNNSRMPISNTSKTQTIKGRTPKFQE